VIAATRQQLEQATASLVIESAELVEGRLSATIRVSNRAGHKFPSGYPSRRVWLRIAVRDDAGALLFESGAWNGNGALVGSEGNTLPSELPGGPFLPHRDVVQSEGDVVMWEGIMGDRDGMPTISLLRAVNYLKDNRILPSGWRADGLFSDRTAPVGTETDPDFTAGSDRVHVDLAHMGNARTIEVTLVYQVLGARWAAELFQAETPDVRAFESMIEAVGLQPVIIGAATFRL
jgi:hypothetical protein